MKKVFVINIECGSGSRRSFGVIYTKLMHELNANPLLTVEVIDSVANLESKCFAWNINPIDSVLLFTNEIVAERNALHNPLLAFMAGGGNIILGCGFSSFTSPDKMNKFFEWFTLPWISSKYDDATFGITNFGRALLTDVVDYYSARAVQLANVPAEQRLYAPLEGLMVQQYGFIPHPTTLAFAAYCRIESGVMAYVGDVNGEDGSIRLIVSMCKSNW